MLAVPLAVIDGAAGPYDDPKAWALPILVGLTVIAWLVEAPGPRALWPPLADRAGRLVRLLALASLAWCAVTTIGSIAPVQSVLGNFGRGMGLLTTGAATALFFVVHSACRVPESVRRLADAALLGSAPVCALGLAQALGWSGMPVAWDPAVRALSVRSTFGQHIALGSYLVLLIPVTAARLDTAWRQWRSAQRRVPREARGVSAEALAAIGWVAGAVAIAAAAPGWPLLWWLLVPWGMLGAAVLAALPRRESVLPAWASTAVLAALLAAQVAVLLLSRARGPLLGLFAGVCVAGCALLWRRRAWRTLAAGAIAAALFVAGLVLLNMPGSPLEPLARVRLLSRLAKLSNVEPGSPVWFRLEVWKGVLEGWSQQVRGETLIPGTSPAVRSATGFGPETELIALDPMAQRALGHLHTAQPAWTAYYLVDRAHNALLEQLVRGGLVGAALWLALTGALLVATLLRVRRSPLDEELALRAGGLGAIVAHAAETQVGIVTAMPLALFWMTAAWVAEPWSAEPWAAGGAVPRPPWWRAVVAAAALATLVVAWVASQWLAASIGYAAGARAAIAGKLADSLPAFERSRALMPWLSLPAEAVVHTRLELARTARDSVAGAQMVAEADRVLTDLRRHAVPGPADWLLLGQVKLAQAQAGDRARLDESLAAFATAARLAPRNADLLAQWAWALRDAGNASEARRLARRAIEVSGPPGSWRAWLVVALAARDLGDGDEAQHARQMARRLAPPASRAAVDSLMR